MKLGQNAYFDEISDEFENGTCGVKNEVTRSNFRKNIMCPLDRGHIFNPILMKLGQNFCLNDEFEKGAYSLKKLGRLVKL